MGREYNKRPVGFAGGLEMPHLSSTSTGTALAWGRSHALTGTTSTANFTIANPVKQGRYMEILCITGATGSRVTATLGSAVSFHSSGNSTALNVLRFDAGNESVVLKSLSSTKVFIVTNTNSVNVS